MNILSVENLKKSYGERTLFENVTFGLNKGQKIGLIAKNGSGKTTLFNMLLDPESADEGQVTFRDGVNVGCLLQDSVFEPGLTIEEAIIKGSGEKVSLLNQYNECVSSGDMEGDKFDDLMTQMELKDVWNLEGKMKEILGNLKISDTSLLVDSLSGGQKKRIALAALLLEEPEFILLDEPTNHLDFDMIEWLEDYLSGPQFTILLVTHDRYFLDNVCDSILEIDLCQMFHYKGNYSYYIQKKAEREFNAQQESDKARNLFKTELEWSRRMPKARTTKSKSRMDNVDELKEKSRRIKKDKAIEFNTKFSRLGSKICEFKKVSHAFGEKIILDKFEYTFKRGEKIGIVGDNGSGKSTFLKLLAQEMEPDSGKIVLGETIVIGHYKQEGLTFDPESKVIDILKQYAEIVELRDGRQVSASQLLTQFHFDPKIQHNFVRKLSGGEKRRLYLLTILIQSPNFLILDEPTNDLDLQTLNTLEEYLVDFPGCLITVSHDRSFLDLLSDHLFVFKGNGVVRDFNGVYTDYRITQKLELIEEKKNKVVEKKKAETSSSSEAKDKKISYKVQFEFDELDKRIIELEDQKNKLELSISNPNLSQEEIMKLSDKMGDVVNELDKKFIRWSELSEYF